MSTLVKKSCTASLWLAAAQQVSNSSRRPPIFDTAKEQSSAAAGMDQRRRIGPIDLAPKPANMHVHEVALWNELVIPHFSEQHFTREHVALATHHILEQTVFARSQINKTIVALDRAFDKVKLEWSRPQLCLAGNGRNPQGSDSVDQLDEMMLEKMRGSAMARWGISNVQCVFHPGLLWFVILSSLHFPAFERLMVQR